MVYLKLALSISDNDLLLVTMISIPLVTMLVSSISDNDIH